MRASCDRGFTFFDVLQASALSTIALVGVSSMLLTTMQATVRGRDITTAATVAEGKIEELRAMNFAAVTTGSDTITDAEIPFTRQWTVVAGPTASTKEVAITVEWPGQGVGGIEVRTIIFD